MLIPSQILVSARALAFVLAAAAAISGCGQKGPLYMPTEPAAAGRATLPQVLNPMGTSAPSPGVSPAPGIPAGPASPVTPGPAPAASAPR